MRRHNGRRGERLWVAAVAVYAFMYLPLAIVVAYSFNDSRLNAEWVGFTLHWYQVLLHGYSNDIFQADLDALQYIRPEVAQNPAVFPSREQQAHLEMLRDLDRHQRRVLSRIWTEIKLR